jgi:hypothetical protein
VILVPKVLDVVDVDQHATTSVGDEIGDGPLELLVERQPLDLGGDPHDPARSVGGVSGSSVRIWCLDAPK